jgi:spore maturation protein CgeB
VFEIAACGGFQLCDPCQGLERHFEFESELPVYRDLGELRAKIDLFLTRDDERAAIAERARHRALREHTYEHRARQMIERIMECHAARIEARGIRAQRTVAEVADRVGRDSPLGRYLASLPPDTPFSQDSLAERIPQMGSPLTRPEGIFAYLRELRTSSEQLLAMFADEN